MTSGYVCLHQSADPLLALRKMGMHPFVQLFMFYILIVLCLTPDSEVVCIEYYFSWCRIPKNAISSVLT